MHEVLGLPEREPAHHPATANHPRGVQRIVTLLDAFGVLNAPERIGQDQHREALFVEDHHLERLRAHAPKQPRYLDADRTPGTLVADWNLIVPDHILVRAWEDQ